MAALEAENAILVRALAAGKKCARDGCEIRMWPESSPGLPRFCPEHNDLNP